MIFKTRKRSPRGSKSFVLLNAYK